MTPSSQLHSNLSLLNLADRREYHTCCEMFKVLKTDAVPALKSKFTYVSDVHTRCLRSTENFSLYQPRIKLEMCKGNFVYRGVQSWMKLLDDLKAIETLDCFKSEIFTHLNRYNVK